MNDYEHTGRFYEDFVVGRVYYHPIGRTITATDNSWFSLLTVNTNPMHVNAHFASQTEFKRPLVNSAITLAVVTGLSVSDMSHNAVNLGWDRVRLPSPLYEGDTVYAESKVISVRESVSRQHQGIVAFESKGLNQDGVVVIEFERTILVYKRSHVARTFHRPRAD